MLTVNERMLQLKKVGKKMQPANPSSGNVSMYEDVCSSDWCGMCLCKCEW